MKELSIEEKAKRYDEAIERARHLEKNPTVWSSDDICQKLFPELKESEDERIRKEMITFFENYHDPILSSNRRKDTWLAWLEKQGEHADFRNKIQIGDKVTRNEDGVLVNLSQLKRVAKPAEEYNITGIGSKHAEGKLGKMIKNLKPTDKIEPKFKVGDIIYKPSNSSCPVHSSTDGTLCTIIEVSDKYYILDTNEGKTQESVVWQDYYELVEQKSTWSEEDKKMSRFIGNAITATDASEYLGSKGIQVIDAHAWLEELKDRVQPKQDWSEEDERIYQSIMDDTVQENQLDDKQTNWLKSLKERYTWKPSAEQMKALSFINTTGGISYVGQEQELINLYNDLKKLRDE